MPFWQRPYFRSLNRTPYLNITTTLLTIRGAATDSGPPGQHIHSGPPAFRGWGGGMAGDTKGYPPR